MKIAIDVSPLQSGHKVRGVGFYLKHLKDALETYFPEHNYTFFTNTSEIPRQVDVIHYPYFDPFFLTLPLKKRAKTVVTVHDLTPIVFPQAFPPGMKGRLRWEVQKQALKRADQIITDSEASRQDVIRLVGIPEKNVHVVYLAPGEEFTKERVSAQEKEAVKKKYELPEKFLLYVGDVTWNKNLPRLLEAVAKTDVPLVMAGKALVEKDFDAMHPWNKDRVKVFKLAEQNKHVYRLGFIPSEDLVTLYQAATAFILPSLYEGFGLPVIEAMSSGTPVITTRGGSLPEVGGKAALFVDGENVENMAQGIATLFKDRELQDELREKGYKQAEKFSWKRTAEETLKVYTM